MLGSHIYDSSITILRYMKHSPMAALFSKDSDRLCVPTLNHVALELGAGCGLVSVWLSKQKLFYRVIATDLNLQLALIENLQKSVAVFLRKLTRNI